MEQVTHTTIENKEEKYPRTWSPKKVKYAQKYTHLEHDRVSTVEGITDT